MKRASFLSGALALLCSGCLAADFDEDYDTKAWQEIAIVLPPAPADKNLKEFFVSAASPNRYAIDLSSFSIGSDGVARYVLVVLAAGGARSVSFEGIRCETRERRIYATGRLDGTWSRSRNNEWARIRDIAPARQHAALFLDYFCPDGVIVRDADEARTAFLRGGHPGKALW